MHDSLNNFKMRLGGIAVTLCLLGCSRPPGSSTEDSSRSAYTAEEQRYRRAEFVLDSLSKLVDTDSLYRLRRATLAPGDTMSILRAISCETFRLTWRHGSIPAVRAIKRMDDTVWSGLSSDMRRRGEQYPGRFVSIPTLASCGTGERASTSVEGVSLMFNPRRPVPPKIQNLPPR